MPTSILSDCLDRLNVLDSALRPLSAPRAFAGSAFTVEEIEAGNLMSHLALQVRPARRRAGDRRQGGDVAGVLGRIADLRRPAEGRGGDHHRRRRPRRRGIAQVRHARVLQGGHARRAAQGLGRTHQPANRLRLDGGRSPATWWWATPTASWWFRGSWRPRRWKRPGPSKAVERSWFQKVAEGVDTADFLGFAEVAKAYRIEVVSEGPWNLPRRIEDVAGRSAKRLPQGIRLSRRWRSATT